MPVKKLNLKRFNIKTSWETTLMILSLILAKETGKKNSSMDYEFKFNL